VCYLISVPHCLENVFVNCRLCMYCRPISGFWERSPQTPDPTALPLDTALGNFCPSDFLCPSDIVQTPATPVSGYTTLVWPYNEELVCSQALRAAAHAKAYAVL